MPRRREQQRYEQVSEFERGRIVGLREGGMSYRDIGIRVGRNASTVMRVWRQWSEEHTTARRPGSGARRRTTDREDRHLHQLALRDRAQTSTQLAQQWSMVTQYPLSPRSVRRRLFDFGLRSRRPLLRLPLTAEHRRLRLEWCQERRLWRDEWHNVIFSDESRFCLYRHDGRVRIRRRQGERENPECIITRHTAPTQGIMVWGAIGYNDRSRLVRIRGTLNSQRYIDEVLRPVVVPYLEDHEGAIFQQDNARPHAAANVRQFLTEHAVVCLPWPARSPDLSPIENVWDMIGRRIQRYAGPASGTEELWERVQAAWNAIPQETIRTLFDSLPRRLQAAIRARGGHTLY